MTPWRRNETSVSSKKYPSCLQLNVFGSYKWLQYSADHPLYCTWLMTCQPRLAPNTSIYDTKAIFLTRPQHGMPKVPLFHHIITARFARSGCLWILPKLNQALKHAFTVVTFPSQCNTKGGYPCLLRHGATQTFVATYWGVVEVPYSDELVVRQPFISITQQVINVAGRLLFKVRMSTSGSTWNLCRSLWKDLHQQNDGLTTEDLL